MSQVTLQLAPSFALGFCWDVSLAEGPPRPPSFQQYAPPFTSPRILHTCGRDRFLSLSHHVCLSWVAILSLVSCERLGGWGSVGRAPWGQRGAGHAAFAPYLWSHTGEDALCHPLGAQGARSGKGERALATLPASVPFSAGSGVVPLVFVVLDEVCKIQDSDRKTEKGPWRQGWIHH